jgi:hypothetical protein
VPELLSFVLVGLWIYCLIDIITSDRAQVRNLPKWAWFLIVFVVPPVGVILWFLLGRPPRSYGASERWSAGGAQAPRPRLPRRSRQVTADRVEDEATTRARIAERDELLARWAEEDRRREHGGGQDG